MVIKVVGWLDFEFRFLLESVYLSSRDKCGLLFQTAASYRAQVVRGKTKGQNFGRIFHFEMAKIDPVWFSLFTLLLERNVIILIATF